MSDFESNLQIVLEKLANNQQILEVEWEDILQPFSGSNDAETINNVYRFIGENFSFKIADGAEGYVYYGALNDETRIWQVVDGVVHSSEGSYKYKYESNHSAMRLQR